MDIFSAFWNNWTNYQKILTLVIVLLCFLIVPLCIYLFTRSKNISLFSVVSLVISGVLIVISFVILRLVFDLWISEFFLISPLIVLFANILNIGTLVGFYSLNARSRDFTFEILYTEFLKDTFKLSFILITLFCLSAIFVSSTLFFLLISSLVVSVLTIWLNYILLPRIIN